MMIMVVLIFGVCWLPYHIYFIVSNVYPDINHHPYIQVLYNWMPMPIHWLTLISDCFLIHRTFTSPSTGLPCPTPCTIPWSTASWTTGNNQWLLTTLTLSMTVEHFRFRQGFLRVFYFFFHTSPREPPVADSFALGAVNNATTHAEARTLNAHPHASASAHAGHSNNGVRSNANVNVNIRLNGNAAPQIQEESVVEFQRKGTMNHDYSKTQANNYWT